MSSLLGFQQQVSHPLVKKSTFPLRKMPVFQGVATCYKNFLLYPSSFVFGTQQQLTHTPVKSSSFPLWKNHVSQGSLLCNAFKLSCLGSLWFGTHLFYSLNPYVRLYYLWLSLLNCVPRVLKTRSCVNVPCLLT